MKNIRGLNKNVSNHTNSLKLRSILSIFTMGIFIFLGFASIDGIFDSNCIFYPQPIKKTDNITIEIYDKGTGKAIQNQAIKFDIFEYVKSPDINSSCKLRLDKSYSKTVTSDDSGNATLTVEKSYSSKDDYILVTFSLINVFYSQDSKDLIIEASGPKLGNRYGFLYKETHP